MFDSEGRALPAVAVAFASPDTEDGEAARPYGQ
jgi:hypothetical protein